MNKIIRWFSPLLVLLFLSGCSREDALKQDCMKVEYVSASDSFCGGPHKIRVLEGADNLKKLYPSSAILNGSIITTLVPEDLRKTGQVFYFVPEAAKPRICTADQMWYMEVGIKNLSKTTCP
ncbi:hypothetical protein [Dyadobacter sp. CY312]|uniref:hypothetical protein n=1 Tax=Dyadobacter sp. CY312 TaxID=2907303 RepID=UPI001F41D48D|nr:hypothetical protein [Dyadobacter sp. CY312]MCE7041711.1 hypothetical protein [Dyadobacter sp. CY312]